MGLRGHCLEAAPQPRNLSRKVFIVALVERAVLTIRARVCSPAHFARVRWRSGNQVPITYGETRRPHSMRAKARTRIHYRRMHGEWTDTGANVRQSGVCTKSAKRRFRTRDLRSLSAKSTTWPRKAHTLAGNRPSERAPIKVVDGHPWSPGVYRALRLMGKPLEVAWEKALIRCSHF